MINKYELSTLGFLASNVALMSDGLELSIAGNPKPLAVEISVCHPHGRSSLRLKPELARALAAELIASADAAEKEVSA